MDVFGGPPVVERGHPFLEGILHQMGAVALVDHRGCARFVSDEACALSGYAREALLALDAPGLFPSAIPWTLLWRTVHMRGPRTMESVLRTCDGRLLSVEIHARPFKLKDGAFLLCLARDLSGRSNTAKENTASSGPDSLAHAQCYREVLENSPEGFLVVEVTDERRFRIVDLNPACARALGADATALLGRYVDEALCPGAAEPLLSQYGRCLQSGTSIDEEVMLTKADGVVWYRSTLVPVRGPDGRIHRLFGLSRDITERKRMENALRERERAFRSLAENLPDNVARYDAAGRLIYANPTLCRTLGIAFESLVGRGLDGLPDTEWARQYRQRLAVRRTSEKPEEIKIAIRTAAGEDQIHLVRFVSERDEQGELTGTLAIGRDITAMEQSAVLLHERAEAFRALVENSPDAIARYDRTGRMVYVNHAVSRTLGSDVAGGIGAPTEEGSPFHPSGGLLKIIHNVLRLGQVFEGEIPYFTSRGEKRWDQVRVVPEYGPDGGIVSALAIGHDITHRKEMEQHLKESRAELRELAAMRETAREEERKRLARELHDGLGQALMALRLEIRMAELQQGEDEAKREARTGRILSLLDKTNRVIKEVVAALRPAALDGGLVPAMEWLTTDFSERTGIACVLDIEAQDIGLEETRAVALFRILQETFTNVARHAKASRVLVRFERNGLDYRLSIRDDGVGFDPTVPRKRSFGLVGMRERALAVGGTLAVSTAPGCGTDVVVLIPVRREQ